MSRASTVVELVPYREEWPRRFARAAEELRSVFSTAQIGPAQIEHVGSTSVVGLSSKDTIDLAVGVQDVAASLTDEVLAALAALGFAYVPASFADDPDHAFLERIVGDRRTDHLHVMRAGVEPMVGHLLFRDHLRSHSDVAAAYEAAKRDLVARYGSERDEYVVRKMPVVQAILAEARRRAAAGDRPGPDGRSASAS